MEKYKNEEWYKLIIQECLGKYNDIPPPWVMNPDTHPYSMGWRMGGGETYMMVFWEWFGETHKGEKGRVEYFLKYPVPPRYFAWVADFIWDLEPWENDDFEYAPYFEKLNNYGFKGTENYEKDLDDEKWLNS